MIGCRTYDDVVLHKDAGIIVIDALKGYVMKSTNIDDVEERKLHFFHRSAEYLKCVRSVGRGAYLCNLQWA